MPIRKFNIRGNKGYGSVNSHPWLEARGLLHLDSAATGAYQKRRAALASPSDASGPIDKGPVLAQHAEPEALLDRERFTPSRFLDGNPTVQLERYPEGEPSLFALREVPKPS